MESRRLHALRLPPAAALLAASLAAKIAWNLLIAYVLALRFRRGEQVGTSLMPYLELALVILCAIAAGFSSGPEWYHDPTHVLLIGLGACVASYVHFALVGALLCRTPPP